MYALVVLSLIAVALLAAVRTREGLEQPQLPATSNTTESTAQPNSSPSTQAPSPMRYEQLRQEFDQKKEEYDALIDTLLESETPTDADIAKVRELNRKMFELLEQSIAVLGVSQSKDMENATRELSEVLARVDREYGILSQNSDRLETLRRIRQFEEVRADGSVGVYMILLILLAVAVLVTMLFSQRVSTTMAIPPASPASTESLT